MIRIEKISFFLGVFLAVAVMLLMSTSPVQESKSEFTEYKIISNGFQGRMEKNVMEHLDDGWQLLGGISASHGDWGDTYYQAVAR